MQKTELKTKIVLGDQTFITPDYAQTRLHNGNGSKAFVARIIGPCYKYGLKREVVKPLSLGKRNAGPRSFPGLKPGIYEFGNFCINETNDNWRRNGFFLVTESGVAEIDLEEAVTGAIELESKEWHEIEPIFVGVIQAIESVEVQEGADDDSQTEPI